MMGAHRDVLARAIALSAMALASAMLLGGCISSGGIRPQAALLDAATLDPGAAIRATQADAGWPDSAWWRRWDDPQLDTLVAAATEGNPGLRVVQARVDAAQYQAQIAGAAALPQAEVGGNFGRQHFPLYATPAPLGGKSTWNNNVAADLSYDLDLWGKNRALREGALDRVHAAAADARFAEVELQTAVVRSYVQLSLQYALLDAYRSIQDQERRTLDIATRRAQARIGSQLEVSQASTQFAASTTRLQEAERQLALNRIAIASLVGKGPGFGDTLAAPTLKLNVDVSLPAVLPAELIGHRADVVAGRWRVAAAGTDIAAAHADFYPNINLVAAVSMASTAPFGGFLNFTDGGGAGSHFGAAISLPIFDGGRRRGSYGVAVAGQDAAVDRYNQTVIGAMQAVAAQVVSLQSLEQQQASVTSTLDAARNSSRLADVGYRSGITEFLNVLAAQNAQLQQQQQLAEVQAKRLDAWALLMKELGGGFEPSAADVALSSGSHGLHDDPDTTGGETHAKAD